MKTNIVLVGTIYEKTKKIAEKLSAKFDLYYANVDDIISYKLFNADEIKKKCGVRYLARLKKELLSDIGSFANSLIFIRNSLFLENKNAELFKTYGTVVFLNYSKEIFDKYVAKANNEVKTTLKVEKLTYDEKVKLCKKYSDVVIDLNKESIESNYKLVAKELEKYYL